MFKPLEVENNSFCSNMFSEQNINTLKLKDQINYLTVVNINTREYKPVYK